MNNLRTAFESGDIAAVQAAVLALPVTTPPTGGQVLSEVLGEVDCVRYTSDGIAFKSSDRLIKEPMAREVILLTTSVSLCGTDLALIDKAHHGQLPKEAVGKVVGHEAAGIIVGVGSDVTKWRIGQIVNLDSHFACGTESHRSFDDCVASGMSCDGIAGGIRGALGSDGKTRLEPIDGYWSRVITVPESALPIEIPLETAKHLVAPSTLESLGNIYMMVEQLSQVGMMDSPAETLCVVSGLGATGYTMASVASHYGFFVAGINPTESKRTFSLEQGACKVAYATISEAAEHVVDKKRVIVVVTAGSPVAYQDALTFLSSLPASIERKVMIAFGLFESPTEPMPGIPADMKNASGAPLPQRDFVFSRHSFTSEAGVEVYGVCGRNLTAWERLMKDLEPVNGEPPKLMQMLNAAQYEIRASDPLEQIAEELSLGAHSVEELLKKHTKIKLVANLLTGRI